MHSPSVHSRFASKAELQSWRQGLESRVDVFLEAVEKDTGRIQAESYLYDWIPLESHFQFLSSNLNFFKPHSTSSSINPLLGRRDLWKRRLPLGDVLIVGTWNFPLALQLCQIVTALACGNKVVFKSSPWTPELKRLFETELPEIFGKDRFSVWQKSDEEVLKAVGEGDFDGLIFTGASSVAKLYAEAAAGSFCKCILEASGSEAAVLHQSALASSSKLEEWVDHLLWGLLHFSGQTCVAPRFWFVPEAQASELWSELKKQLSFSKETLHSRPQLRHEGVAKEFDSWVQWSQGLEENSELFIPSEKSPASFVKLSSIRSLPLESPPSFGPGAVIIPFSDLSEVVRWIQKSPWSLMTQVFCEELSAGEQHLLEQVETTIVSFGESIVSVGDASVPFGGMRRSGMGVTHGLEGLAELTRVQTWIRAKSWPLTSAWMRPSWKNIPKLPKLVGTLRAMKSNPLKAVVSLMEKN